MLAAPRKLITWDGHDYVARLVATVTVDGATDHYIWALGKNAGFLTAPASGSYSELYEHHSTIRRAFSWACKQEGWG